jgi:heme-degrading monooxygenase HmoA
MFVVIWMFHVRPEHEEAFLAAYGSEGDWARLFQRAQGFLGSELLRDQTTPLRYVTIDRWTSAVAWESFQNQWRHEYDVLDRACDEWTEQEMKVGEYESAGLEARPRG